MNNIYKIWMIVISLQILTGSIAKASDEDLRTWFLSHYKKSFQYILTNYTNIEYEYVSIENKYKRHYMGKFDLYNYIQKYIVYTKDKKIKSMPIIGVGNKMYRFEIRDMDDKQILTDLQVFNSDYRGPWMPFMAPLGDRFVGKTYLDIIQDSDTELISIEDVNHRNRQVKKLTASINYINPVSKSQQREKKSYYFSQNEGWICYGWSNYPKDGQSRYLEEFYEYENNGNVYPPLKSIVLQSRDIFKKDFSELIYKLEFTKFTRANHFDEREFTLSAFGLPEPVGLERPVRWWLWAGVAGVLLILLGAVFFRLAHRRRMG